jgi:excisionase family DNA binding protein
MNRREDPLLSYEEAAHYIGRTRSQISALIMHRELKPVPRGREQHIPRAQLDRWIRCNHGSVEDYQARLSAQRDVAWVDFKAEAHEAVERAKTQQQESLIQRAREIVWRNQRREIRRLRAKAEAQGIGGLFPKYPSKADLESWSRRLDKLSRMTKPKPPPLAPKPQAPPSIQPAKPWPR